MTTLKFIEICTKSFEHRSTTKVQLDNKGSLIHPTETFDIQSSVSPSQKSCEFVVDFPQCLFMTTKQQLMYRHNGSKFAAYNMVTQFSPRPVKIMELFPSLENYFRWFNIYDKAFYSSTIEPLLHVEI